MISVNFFTQIATKKIKITLYISIIIFIFAALYKDKLPDKKNILEQIYQEPIQKEATAGPFTIEVKGIEYDITPIYDYELYGLVASYHHSNVWWDYDHRDSKDFVNTADICVIWGKNVETEVYKKMKFSNLAWTCYAEFRGDAGSDIRSNFKPNCLSNNHLVTDSDSINSQIMNTEKGDQVYVKGYLIDYTQKDWKSFKRKSSTTRIDRGCEVIYVTDFKILKKSNYLWRYLYIFVKYIIIGCIIILVIKFFKESACTIKG